jgi:hypothetical protein
MCPAIGAKEFLDRARRIARGADINGAFVNEHRERRIVRHSAIVLEHEGERFGWHSVTTNFGTLGCVL